MRFNDKPSVCYMIVTKDEYEGNLLADWLEFGIEREGFIVQVGVVDGGDGLSVLSIGDIPEKVQDIAQGIFTAHKLGIISPIYDERDATHPMYNEWASQTSLREASLSPRI